MRDARGRTRPDRRAKRRASRRRARGHAGRARARADGLAGSEIDDVIFGCAMPEAEHGLNVARIAALRAGVPVPASAVTVSRFRASGLEAIAIAAARGAVGSARAVIAGGTES